jgi:hypothetical protein
MTFSQSFTDLGPRALMALMLVMSLTLTGCISKSKAQAHVRAAYLAGQRDAVAHMNQQQTGDTGGGSIDVSEPSNVTFIGPVENPIVPWTDGLTLARAILTAVYQSQQDPVMILIKRSNEEVQIQPSRLLNGGDFPLRPGDIVELQLPEQ